MRKTLRRAAFVIIAPFSMVSLHAQGAPPSKAEDVSAYQIPRDISQDIKQHKIKLTDDQKQAMERISGQYQPEFQNLHDRMKKLQEERARLMETILAQYKPQLEGQQKKLEAFMRQENDLKDSMNQEIDALLDEKQQKQLREAVGEQKSRRPKKAIKTKKSQ